MRISGVRGDRSWNDDTKVGDALGILRWAGSALGRYPSLRAGYSLVASGWRDRARLKGDCRRMRITTARSDASGMPVMAAFGRHDHEARFTRSVAQLGSKRTHGHGSVSRVLAARGMLPRRRARLAAPEVAAGAARGAGLLEGGPPHG